MILLPQRPISNVWISFFPLLYLVVVIILDHHIHGSPLLPPLLTLGLLILSVLISQGWMIIWAGIYAGTVLVLFFNPCFYAYESCNLPPPQEAAMYFRPCAFCCVALFTVIFNRLLNKHRKGFSKLHEIIMKFPYPLLITDASGRIIDCNGALSIESRLTKDELLGRSFFDFFSPSEQTGYTIAKYLKLFEQETSSENLSLTVRNESYSAELLPLETWESKMTLMILKKKAVASH